MGVNSTLFGTDLVDYIRGLLTFDGGSGYDHLVVNDDKELADNVVTVAKHTISGLDMAPVNEVQTVTVRASTGTFRLTFNGQTTSPLPYDLAPRRPGGARGPAPASASATSGSTRSASPAAASAASTSSASAAP